VNQEESELNEVDGTKKGADSTVEVQGAYLKERLVICNDEDTGGRARVTTDEERFYLKTEQRCDCVGIVRLAGCKNFVGE